jgi:hypothetical protein
MIDAIRGLVYTPAQPGKQLAVLYGSASAGKLTGPAGDPRGAPSLAVFETRDALLFP